MYAAPELFVHSVSTTSDVSTSSFTLFSHALTCTDVEPSVGIALLGAISRRASSTDLEMFFGGKDLDFCKSKPAVTAGFPLDISTLRSITELIGAPTTALVDRMLADLVPKLVNNCALELILERHINEDERPKLALLTHVSPRETNRPITSVRLRN